MFNQENEIKKIYTRYILPMKDGESVLRNRCLILDKNKILAIEKVKDEDRDKIENLIILPAFINAHAHLDLSFPAKEEEKIIARKSFTEWIKIVKAKRSDTSDEEKAKSSQKGIESLVQSGVLGIMNIQGEAFILEHLLKSPLSGRNYIEYIGLEDLYKGNWETVKKLFFDYKNQSKKYGFDLGISLHSPYTISPDAFDLVEKEWFLFESQKDPVFTQIHLAESEEEKLFFLHKKGPLFDWIINRDPSFEKIKKQSMIQYLLNKKFLDNQSLFIHTNIIEPGDMELLKTHKLRIVHCPRSHDFFKHPPFQLKEILENKIPLAIGTDSLMSNENLNFFHELRFFKKSYPFLKSERILKMVTLDTAEMMNFEKGWGMIQENMPFALIAIKIPSLFEKDQEIFDYIINKVEKIDFYLLSHHLKKKFYDSI